MSIIIHCTNPACANLLQAGEDMVGKRVQCPTCKEIIEVPRPAAPENEIIELTPEEGITAEPPLYSEPKRCPECNAELAEKAVLCVECGYDLRTGKRLATKGGAGKPRKKNKLKRQQFKLTNLGLGCHYAKVVCSLVRILVTILALILMTMVGESAARAGDAAAIVIGLGGAALGITGSILCCNVPPNSGSRPLIIASLSLDGVAVLLSIPAALLEMLSSLGIVGAGAAATSMVLGLLAAVCSLAAFVLFMLFLRGLARYLDADALGDEAMGVITHVALLVGGVFLGGCGLGGVAAVLHIPAVFVPIVLGVAILIFVINLLLRILNLIGAMRQLLETRVAG